MVHSAGIAAISFTNRLTVSLAKHKRRKNGVRGSNCVEICAQIRQKQILSTNYSETSNIGNTSSISGHWVRFSCLEEARVENFGNLHSVAHVECVSMSQIT